MTTYIEPQDTVILKKIGINVAVLVAVAFALIGVAMVVT